ncbi:MAG: NUDIX domain-containing protein [Oscillospiraceae bacterium]|nr:NUDIX domain-containing protein [Oscillospiraceae bacterium]
MSELRWPVPGVAVIVMDGEKIALVKRMGSEKWSIPCGCIDYGEDFVHAAVREVKEEIGIDSEPVKIFNVASNSWSANGSMWIGSSIAVVLISRPLSFELTADGVEVTEAKWFDITGTLPELEFVADKYPIEKIKESLLSQTEISGILLSDRQTSFIQL